MALYLSCPTIPLKYRLKKKDTFIIMLINRLEMKRADYELEEIFGPLVKDLRFIMEQGITKKILNDDGSEMILKFKIVISAVCGDNKGIYEFLGYQTAFTSKTFICRICGAKANQNELDRCKETINFRRISYEEALKSDRLIEAPSKKTYGLKSKCIFTELPNHARSRRRNIGEYNICCDKKSPNSGSINRKLYEKKLFTKTIE
ncbi:hypothetical protein BLA29_001921 [Euroglyphus maynei]|uniref:Uncharacterized protein n=1 Tax=Euroglyphus maynei TaxID=6958 RepID=A0A1Y3B2R0_EURMA|nr:hypothetical protein BLA29_001921 [Euroglyphus maynei]